MTTATVPPDAPFARGPRVRFARRGRAMVRALAAPMLVAAGLAQAVGLGEVTQQSALGSALRIVVPIIVGPGENMAGECLRLVPSGRSSDGIPEVTTARVAFERTADGARAVVTSPRAAVDPVLRLTLQAGCDSTVRREYTLLMDPPVIGAPVAAPPEAPVPASRVLTAPSSAPAPRRRGAPAAGAGTGAAAAPKARPAPRRRAATTVAAAPGVPATAIAGAAAAPAAAPKAEAAPARRAPAPAAAARAPAPAVVPAPQPKLTVSSAAPAGEAAAPGKGQAPIPVERGPAARAGSPTAETAAALDAEAAALQQRVVELTALVDKMQAEMKEAETKQAAQAAASRRREGRARCADGGDRPLVGRELAVPRRGRRRRRAARGTPARAAAPRRRRRPGWRPPRTRRAPPPFRPPVAAPHPGSAPRRSRPPRRLARSCTPPSARARRRSRPRSTSPSSRTSPRRPASTSRSIARTARSTCCASTSRPSPIRCRPPG